MSNKAVSWAFDVTGLTSTQKFLLVALADYADEADSCYPGQAKLADRVGATRETVSRNLAKLEELGFIRRERRYREGGFRSSDRFVLTVGLMTPDGAQTLCDESSRDEKSCDSDALPYVTQNEFLCDANRGAIEPSGEPPVEPPVKVDLDDLFDDAYYEWPKKEKRKPASEKFKRLAREKDPVWLAQRIMEFGRAYQQWEGEYRQYVPALLVWLNQERWDESLPQPRRERVTVTAQQSNADWDWMTR